MSSKSRQSYSTSLPRKSKRFENINEFTIIKQIGRGGYSNVYLAEHKKTGKRYAIKACFRYKKGKDKSKRSFMEIKVLRKLKHENIVSLKGWFEDAQTIYLVLEYINGKDITKFFEHKQPNKSDIKNIMRQLITAILYIHKKGIIHRDLKLENVLINDELTIKITDFGLCTIKESEFDTFTSHLGTARYSSPEMLNAEPYNCSVDIWAIGIMLFKLITGKYPFDGSNKDKIFNRIQEKKIHWSKYYFSRSEESLLRKLLTKDPDDRIEIEDILDHRYFR